MARKLQEVKDIKISLNDLATENEKLIQEIKILRDSNEYLNNNQADWKRDQEDSKTKLRELECLLKDEARKCQEAEFDLDKLTKQIGKKTSEIEHWKTTALELEQDLKEIESIKRKFSAIAAENESLATVIEQYEIRENEGMRKIEDLESQVGEYKEVRFKIEQVKKEKEKFESALDLKTAELNEMQLKLQESNKRADSLVKLKDEVLRVAEEKGELNRIIDFKNAENERYKEVIRDNEKKISKTSKIENKYNAIAAENEKLSQLISLRIQDNDAYREKIKKLEHELQKLATLQREIESLGTKKRAEEMVNRRTEDAENWRKKHVASDKRVLELELKIQGLQRDLSHQKSIIKDKTKQIDELDAKLQNLEKQTIQMEELESRNTKLEAQNESMSQDLHSLEGKQKTLLARKQELEKNEDFLYKTQRELAEAKAKNESISQELQALEGKQKILFMKKQELEKKSQEEIKSLESNNLELTREKSRIPQLESEVRVLEDERNKLLLKNKELGQQLEEKNNELRSTKEKLLVLLPLEGQLGAKQTEINRMLEILNESNKKEEGLKSRILGLEADIKQQRGENEYLRRECDSLTAMLLEKSNEIDRLMSMEQKLQTKELEVDSLTRKVELLRDENLSKTKDLQEKDRLLEESYSKVKELDKNIRLASRDNERLESLLKEKENQNPESRINLGSQINHRGIDQENTRSTLESEKGPKLIENMKPYIGIYERDSFKESNRHLERSKKQTHQAKSPTKDIAAKRSAFPSELNRNLSPIFEEFRNKFGDSLMQGKARNEKRY